MKLNRPTKNFLESSWPAMSFSPGLLPEFRSMDIKFLLKHVACFSSFFSLSFFCSLSPSQRHRRRHHQRHRPVAFPGASSGPVPIEVGPEGSCCRSSPCLLRTGLRVATRPCPRSRRGLMKTSSRGMNQMQRGYRATPLIVTRSAIARLPSIVPSS